MLPSVCHEVLGVDWFLSFTIRSEAMTLLEANLRESDITRNRQDACRVDRQAVAELQKVLVVYSHLHTCNKNNNNKTATTKCSHVSWLTNKPTLLNLNIFCGKHNYHKHGWLYNSALILSFPSLGSELCHSASNLIRKNLLQVFW